jgi:hypothetical protein
MKKQVIYLAILVLSVVTPITAIAALALAAMDKPVMVSAYPHGFTASPATVMVTARVDPRPENRQLIIMLDTADGDAQRTDRELWGENAPIVWSITYKDLGAGTYTPIAVVTSVDSKGQTHVTRATGEPVIVRPALGEEQP